MAINNDLFIPYYRSTSTRARLDSTTTTPFVRIPFGPFSSSDRQKQENNSNNNSNNNKAVDDKPKVSVSVSTSLTKSSSSSSSSEAFEQSSTSSTTESTTKGISSYDELDRLQSSLGMALTLILSMGSREGQVYFIYMGFYCFDSF